MYQINIRDEVLSICLFKAFVLNASETADRPPSPFFDKISNNCGVMTLNYGKRFKSQRNFGFTKLRGYLIFIRESCNYLSICLHMPILRFGVGKKSMEDRISEDIYFLSETVREKQGKPFDLHVNCKMYIISAQLEFCMDFYTNIIIPCLHNVYNLCKHI